MPAGSLPRMPAGFLSNRVTLTRVSRAVDVFAILLLVAAAFSFAFGVHALGDRQDFKAIYLLVIGGLSLKASTEILRPRGGSA